MVEAQSFKLINSVRDFILDYLRDEFLRRVGVNRSQLVVTTAVMNLDAFYFINLILNHYGVGHLVKMLWWITLL